MIDTFSHAQVYCMLLYLARFCNFHLSTYCVQYMYFIPEVMSGVNKSSKDIEDEIFIVCNLKSLPTMNSAFN